jgi:hypothetical protein
MVMLTPALVLSARTSHTGPVTGNVVTYGDARAVIRAAETLCLYRGAAQ